MGTAIDATILHIAHDLALLAYLYAPSMSPRLNFDSTLSEYINATNPIANGKQQNRVIIVATIDITKLLSGQNCCGG